jgi:hypothetical protein
VEPDHFHSFAVGSFGGVQCAQMWCDFYLWEAVLNSNPQLTGIVELGTWEGGFSRYLASQAWVRGLAFTTFDSVVPNFPTSLFPFHKVDIYRYPEQIAGHLTGPVALFCDGGNKPRELATFPQLCHPESIVLVHDWGTETTEADVPGSLREIYGEFCDTIGSVTRVFAIKPEEEWAA